MSRARRLYPSDLDDEQWQHIERLLPRASARGEGRRRTTSLRRVFDAIFYINRTGCAWRYLPTEFPPWQTVYAYYRAWLRKGLLRRVHDALVRMVREHAGKKAEPSTLMVDSQSIKAHWGDHRGFDGFKKVIGRKRSIFVDTLGLIHGVRSDAASLGEYKAACTMVERLPDYNLKALYADAGYRAHDFQNAVHERFRIWPTITASTHRADGRKGKILTSSNLKPTRWIVERTFAWLNHFRRLTRDYERRVDGAQAMVLVAMIQLMLRRLTRKVGTYRRWN
jgi:putative transposase